MATFVGRLGQLAGIPPRIDVRRLLPIMCSRFPFHCGVSDGKPDLVRGLGFRREKRRTVSPQASDPHRAQLNNKKIFENLNRLIFIPELSKIAFGAF